jgi:hypothetical protein
LNRRLTRGVLTAFLAWALGLALPCAAQTTPAASTQPADDTPSVRLGVTLFADYTVQQAPAATDADGNTVTANAFNVGRAFINVTGRISHLVTFRLTPDIVRESGTGSSLSGSDTFRLKYAYAQFALDPLLKALPSGNWVRFGLQQTPWVDFIDPVYRYRFQGPTFEDREGFSSSSDAGAGFHTNLPGNYGDLEGGFYNGETFARQEVNDRKALMLRGTLRPLPGHPLLRGLRISGFYDKDAYLRNADRVRAIVAVTFEHKHLNAAFDRLGARDQTSAATRAVEAHGYTVWATPRAANGWEGLLRFDHLQPGGNVSATHTRSIGGVAYWFPHQGTVAAAVLLDAETVRFTKAVVNQPAQRRFALHALVTF